MKIEISDSTFKRLQKYAVPLVDSVEAVIIKLMESYETGKNPKKKMEIDLSDIELPRQKMFTPLKGFTKELWDLVILKIPSREFSLGEVYAHMGPLQEKRPHVQELEASIRAALQKLRDSNYVEFINNRGWYRRIKE